MSQDIVIPADFKTTLPPRKRAKTQQEKEQRKIERILRNRKAAHQSREKKRVHLQQLEHKCRVMECLLGRLGDLDGLVNDKRGKELLKEFRSLGASSPCGSGSSPEASSPSGASDADADAEADAAVNVTPAKSESESEPGQVQVQTPSKNEFGLSDFPAPFELTPVSFVEEDPKNFNLVLTDDTLAPTQPSQPFWLEAEEDSGSFELDDWRNPEAQSSLMSFEPTSFLT
ncbi:HAC1 (YFL031W) [Zygosaccharomyces parabailii]|nr:HAC1 (YFL031W) [Zygosaccharomyces parabailii]